MKITSKGQVTIPIEIRERLGLLPNTDVDIQLQGNAARLVKATATPTHRRGAEIIKRLQDKADVKMTTDQILALTR